MTGKLLRFFKQLVHRLLVMAGAAGMTLLFFLVLPLIQTINQPPQEDSLEVSSPVAYEPPPPPPPEEEEPEEPEEPEEAPELEEETPPLTLDQLQLALNPGFGGEMPGGDFKLDLNTVAGGGGDVDELFSMADLDQRPRPIYQPSPQMSAEIRRAAPGTVHIIFIVNEQGHVERPTVQQSTNPVFEQAALNAVRRWRFEPGQRGGEPVRFRMRVPIIFPEQ